MILRVPEASGGRPNLLRLTFHNGAQTLVDMTPLQCGSVFSPNGADFAPEALYKLAAVEETTVA